MPRFVYQLALLAVFGVASVAQAQRGPGGPPGGGHGLSPMGGPGGMMGQPTRNDILPNGAHMGGAAGMVTRGGPQLGPPGRWWDDKRTSKTLNLSSEQQHHMDDIFNANKGQLLTLYGNLQREEQKLGSLSKQDLADESKVFAGIDRVAQARADLEKENAHILLQIRKELDGDQLARLDREIAAR